MSFPPNGPRNFATTQWSLVLAASRDRASQSVAQKALSTLCKAYWFPLYAFVRRRGYSPEDAQDLVQAFFAHIIESSGLALVDPTKGRFRSYLLGAIKHFLAHDRERRNAKKRGGGKKIVELDALDPEARFGIEPAVASDPEARFDQEWARELTARTLEELRLELAAQGKSELFEALKGSLTGEEPSREETAGRLGLTQGAVKVAVHRLRKRYREMLRANIAETVDDPAEIDDEMRCLVKALLGK